MDVKIEHRIGIRAPADVIWDAISDLSAWQEWNPLYPRAHGVLRIGAQLDLDVAIPGRKVRTIRPVILDWVPNDQIHWRLSILGGLIQSTRYIEIETLTEAGCIFSNGELFRGRFAPLALRRVAKDMRKGFAAMGEAVKARAEAAYEAAGS
ncbi:MAG TPA: SRPBCC domain-containing protein [Caulobacteraceae bacterium]|nr:SRPBCC domain-containing protein [Caulobacteraceae bacterium]